MASLRLASQPAAGGHPPALPPGGGSGAGGWDALSEPCCLPSSSPTRQQRRRQEGRVLGEGRGGADRKQVALPLPGLAEALSVQLLLDPQND